MFVANLNKTRDRSNKFNFLKLFSSRKQKHHVPANCQILIQKNIIRIITDQGTIAKEVDIKNVDKIIMNDPYDIGYGKIPKHYADIKGKNARNMILLEKDSTTQKFDFKIDSNRDILELRKQILYWKSIGFDVHEKSTN